MDRRADLVHLGEPDPDVVLGFRQRQRSAGANPADPGIQPDDALRHGGDVGEAARGQPLQQWQRHGVGVHVQGGRPVRRVRRLPVDRWGVW